MNLTLTIVNKTKKTNKLYHTGDYPEPYCGPITEPGLPVVPGEAESDSCLTGLDWHFVAETDLFNLQCAGS